MILYFFEHTNMATILFKKLNEDIGKLIYKKLHKLNMITLIEHDFKNDFVKCTCVNCLYNPCPDNYYHMFLYFCDDCRNDLVDYNHARLCGWCHEYDGDWD